MIVTDGRSRVERGGSESARASRHISRPSPILARVDRRGCKWIGGTLSKSGHRGHKSSPRAARPAARETAPTAGWLDRAFEGRSVWILVTAAVLLAFLLLSPLLGSVFYGDDVVNSLYAAKYFGASQTSLYDLIAGSLRATLGMGRLYPLGEYARILFYLVNGSTFAYKLFIILMVISNLLLFRVLVLKLTRSQGLGLLAMLLAPLMIQLRYTDDPITSYYGLLQIVMLYTLVALIAFVFYLDTRRRRYLVAGLVAYGACLLTYEVGLPFFLIFVAVAYLYPERRRFVDALKVSWPFMALAIAVAGVTIALRLATTVALTGSAAGPYALSPDAGAFFDTFIKQTAGALPLSYWTAYLNPVAAGFGWLPYAPPLPGFVGTFGLHPLAALVLVVGYGALVYVACARAVSERRGNKEHHGLAPLTAAGAGLLVLSGVLISLSSKYQGSRWVTWGVSYLPVYIAYFGVAALLAVGLFWLLRRAKSGWVAVAVVAAVLAVFVAVADYGNNASVVAGWAEFYDYPRAVEQSALEAGLMKDVPEGAALLTQGRDWEIPQYFLVYAGRTLSAVDKFSAVSEGVRALATGSTATTGGVVLSYAPGSLRLLRYEGQKDGNGYALLGLAQSITVSQSGEVVDAQYIPTDVYLSWPSTPAAPTVAGAAPTPRYDSLQSLGLDPAQWSAESQGPTWALYRAKQAAIAP